MENVFDHQWVSSKPSVSSFQSHDHGHSQLSMTSSTTSQQMEPPPQLNPDRWFNPLKIYGQGNSYKYIHTHRHKTVPETVDEPGSHSTVLRHGVQTLLILVSSIKYLYWVQILNQPDHSCPFMLYLLRSWTWTKCFHWEVVQGQRESCLCIKQCVYFWHGERQGRPKPLWGLK